MKVIEMYLLVSTVYALIGIDNKQLAAYCCIGLDFAKIYNIENLCKPNKDSIHVICALK